jgi:hypothetical protein
VSLKKTDMERLKAASLEDHLRKAAPPAQLLERSLEK